MWSNMQPGQLFLANLEANFQNFSNPSWPTGGPSGQTVSSASLTQINQD